MSIERKAREFIGGIIANGAHKVLAHHLSELIFFVLRRRAREHEFRRPSAESRYVRSASGGNVMSIRSTSSASDV